jgi:catechol 2,3-dioxygenase-like lactoylglutathione lyase family enzyme
MRSVMKLMLLAASVLLFAAPARAQLAPFNPSGVTYGHVHVSTGNADAMKKMWVEQFGAVLATKGTFTIAKLPGMMVAFRGTAPTGGTEGAAMDHFGLKVPSVAQAVQKWRAAGFEVQREFKGSEGFPNAFLIGPDGLRFELQEDTTLKVPAAAYHVHFRVPDPAKLRDWYVETFGLTPGKSGNFETAEAPGMRLLFQQSQAAPTVTSTKGTTVDHIGFEVKNLKEFYDKLIARGVKFDVAYREVPEIGLNISYLTDPAGTYIEVTQGYTGF